MWGISWVGEELLACQKDLCSVQSVTHYGSCVTTYSRYLLRASSSYSHCKMCSWCHCNVRHLNQFTNLTAWVLRSSSIIFHLSVWTVIQKSVLALFYCTAMAGGMVIESQKLKEFERIGHVLLKHPKYPGTLWMPVHILASPPYCIIRIGTWGFHRGVTEDLDRLRWRYIAGWVAVGSLKEGKFADHIVLQMKATRSFETSGSS